MSSDIQNTNRLSYVDIGAGVMIIWLLYYHALWPMYEREILNVFPWLFYFMPWFFYKSGYFFKPKSLKESIKKDAGKLLKQFAIWSAIGYVVYILCRIFLFDDLSLRNAFYTPLRSLFLGGSIPLNSALWFLLTLFVVRQIALVVTPKCNALWMGLIGAVIACILHFVNYQFTPFTIYSTAWGLCFFAIGYAMKKYEQNTWVIIASAIVLLLTFTMTDIPEVYKKEDTCAWYWYVLWYPASIAGCVVFNNICRWLEKAETKAHTYIHTYIHTSLFSPIKWVGRHSMTFYVAHFIIFKVVYDLIGKYHEAWYAGWQGVLIITIAYIGLIVPLCFMIDKIQKGYAK